MVGYRCKPEWLSQRLSTSGGQKEVLLLDCRSTTSYQASHVLGAINLVVPTLMLRRLDRGNLPIESIIRCQDGRERFSRQCKSATIILIDDCSRELDCSDVTSSAAAPRDDVDRLQRSPGTATTVAAVAISSSSSAEAVSRNVMKLLLKRLEEDGCQVRWLEGGFAAFSVQFAHLCVYSGDVNDDSQSTILGLGYLCLSSTSSSPSSEGGGRSNNERTSDPSSDNTPRFPVEVLPHLYLGDAKNSEDLEGLAKNGIRYILNVTPNVPNKFERNEEFRYMQIPINDHWSQNLTVYFPDAIAFIDEARRQKCGVLVHCLAGISRSVTITVAYLMHTLTLSLNDAYDHVKLRKPNISPNFSFMGQLMDYERALRLERGYSVDCAACCRAAAATAGSASSSSSLAAEGDDLKSVLDGLGLPPCVCHLVDSSQVSSPPSSLSSLSSAAATSSSATSATSSSSAFDYEVSSTTIRE